MLVYPTMAPILNMPIFIFRRMVILPLPIQLSLRNGGKNSGSCKSVTCSNDMSRICCTRMEPFHSVRWDAV